MIDPFKCVPRIVLALAQCHQVISELERALCFPASDATYSRPCSWMAAGCIGIAQVLWTRAERTWAALWEQPTATLPV